jgi:hypothetical protein
MKRIDRFRKKEGGKKNRAVRLTFSYEGDAVKLIKQQPLEMIAPPSDELRQKKEASGFWVEVHNLDRKVVYRRATENPIKKFVEVRSDDPDRPLAMVEVEEPSGIFTILIPEIIEGGEIALFSSPLKREKTRKPAVEIGRYKLPPGKQRKEE